MHDCSVPISWCGCSETSKGPMRRLCRGLPLLFVNSCKPLQPEPPCCAAASPTSPGTEGVRGKSLFDFLRRLYAAFDARKRLPVANKSCYDKKSSSDCQISPNLLSKRNQISTFSGGCIYSQCAYALRLLGYIKSNASQAKRLRPAGVKRVRRIRSDGLRLL